MSSELQLLSDREHSLTGKLFHRTETLLVASDHMLEYRGCLACCHYVVHCPGAILNLREQEDTEGRAQARYELFGYGGQEGRLSRTIPMIGSETQSRI